jgi:hypothetical protein
MGQKNYNYLPLTAFDLPSLCEIHSVAHWDYPFKNHSFRRSTGGRQLERLALVEKKFGLAKLAGRVQVNQPSVKQDNIASILKKGGVGSAATKCKELAKQYKAWAKELDGLKD